VSGAVLTGVLESRLTAAAAARLPDAAPPAPWAVRLEAVVWLHPATAAGRELAPPGLPVTVGGLVRYLDTPVGPYSEVLASPVLIADGALPAATVPFIAVDSAASVHGGRENWALPKVFARFEWAAAGFAAQVTGEDAAAPWGVTVAVRARRRRLPVRLAGRARQPRPGGRVPIRLSGALRLATVAVETSGPTLPAWLPSGRYPGAVFDGEATIGPSARPLSAG
jgi:hypothetical protein